MSLMEFTEILAAQLLHNNFADVDTTENDPDNYPTSARKKSEGFKKSMQKNDITKYYHLTTKGVQHKLVKSGLRTNKNGKSYNKTNDCTVCKRLNIRRQTAFICSTCSVALCAPVLSERSEAPKDCFRRYHENEFLSCEFSTASLDEFSPSDSEDSWFETKPGAKRKKCSHSLKTVEI